MHGHFGSSLTQVAESTGQVNKQTCTTYLIFCRSRALMREG